MNQEDIEDILALTPMQEGMLFHYLKDPKSDYYFEQLSLGISGVVNTGIFEKAWNFVIETNEMLRTAFRWEKIENPLQIILKEHQLVPKYYDLSGMKPNEKKMRLENIKIEDRNEKFDLLEVPFRVILCKLDEKKYEMIISNHHILYDGWSNGIILKEFISTYNHLTHKKKPRIPVKSKFKEFIKWVRHQDQKAQENFWKTYLGGFEAPTTLSVKQKQTTKKAGSSPGNFILTFSKDTGAQLEKFIRRHRFTTAVLLYAAWGLLLQRYNNSADVIFGTTVSGRSAKLENIGNMAGLFISTVPLRVKTYPREQTIDLLKRIDKSLQTREPFESTSLVKIKEYCPLNFHETESLFDSLVVIENYPLAERLKEQKGDLSIDSYSIFEMTNYDLTISVSLSGEIAANFIYNHALFEQEGIRGLSRHFANILKDIIKNHSKEVHRLEILSDQDKRQLLVDFNTTAADYPRDKTIQELFTRQAAGTGDRAAVIGPGATAITYKEFDEKSNRLAGVLREKGLDPGSIAAVMLERSLEMMVGIFGILKSGAAYLPIDPDYPQDRIDYMLKDSGAKILVTTNNIEGKKVRRWEGEKVLLEEIPESLKNSTYPLTFLPSYLQSSSNLTYPLTFRQTPSKLFIDNGFESNDSLAIGNWQLTIDNSKFPNEFPGLKNEQKQSDARIEASYLHNSSNPAAIHRPPATSLAYIIYTSGSTGRPKGVMIEHSSLVNRINWMQKCYPIGAGDVILQKTPVVFDVSVWELFWWSIQGASLSLLAPGEEKNPQAVAAAIASKKVTTMHFVPSMLNVFLEYLEIPTPDVLTQLSSLKQVFSSGEALLIHHVERFNRLLNRTHGTHLINLYGPTEATVDVSYYHCRDDETRETIPIGKPIDNIGLYVIDSHFHLQPPGAPGELCISGVGLARGYLNRPELTDEKFIMPSATRNPFEKGFLDLPKLLINHHSPFTIHHSPIYKTGDLARWLPDGNIEFLGRLDHQVKIRGYRIELGEIENRLLNHKDVKEAVVIARKDNNNEDHLCGYIVTGKEHLPADLEPYLSQKLPDYMIPSYFVQLDRLPLTPNGKIDHRALSQFPISNLKSQSKYIPPGNETEEKLVRIWADVLGIETNIVGIDTNFFRLGGHSLKAARLLSRVHKEFDVNVPLAELFNMPTIRELSRYIAGTGKETFVPIEPADKKEYYCLSSAQRRLYILHQMIPGAQGYQLAYRVVLEGVCNIVELQESFRRLIRRHESLRTSFRMIHGEPVQVIHAEVEFQVENYKLQDTNYKQTTIPKLQTTKKLINCQGRGEVSSPSPIGVEKIIENFIRPFDLSQAPLLRVGLVKTKENQHLLMVDMHHIIYDGISQSIFFNELFALYEGKELPLLKLQYKDYAEWQGRQMGTSLIKRQEEYWINRFAGEIPLLDLPLDFARPPQVSFDGDRIDFDISREETEALKALAGEKGATLFMVLLSIYIVFLHRISGQEDIVVGIPTAGRGQPDIQPVIGNFLNTLALRTYPAGDQPFDSLLRQVKDAALEAFANQDFPFEAVVEKVTVQRNLNRSPLFDVMFILHNQWDSLHTVIPQQLVKGLKLKPYPYERTTSEFDLVLNGLEGSEGLYLGIQYSTKLFKTETLHRFCNYFKNIVAHVLKKPKTAIGEIEIISLLEKQQVLENFNNTAAAYPAEKTIHDLFKEQVEKTPDAVAVVGKHQLHHERISGLAPLNILNSITYRQLDQKANQWVIFLQAKGVRFDTVVGLRLGRSIEMLIGIFAILKAGGAYLPIDPGYPQERILYMLKDSGAKILVTTNNIEGEKVRRWEGEKVLLEEIPESLKNSTYPLTFLPSYLQISSNLAGHRPPAASLANVIYTSGSTGEPRGVMIKHRSVINFIKGITDIVPFCEKDVILSLTTISFDIFGLETILPLTRGSRVVMGSEEEQLNPAASAWTAEREHVTIFQVTPSRLRLMVSNKKAAAFLGSLHHLLVGGEAFPESLLETVKLLVKGKIYNVYGPTETTIWSTIKDLTGNAALNIGKPIANTQVYILNKNNRPQPVRVTGQLCLAGDGLASGYANRPELTAEKFIMPSATRGALFEKTAPLDPLQKLFIVPLTTHHSPLTTHHSPIYKTGDLARWLPDGDIQFLGRLDHQVKIRGYRIELGEIQSRLQALEEVRDAVVIVKEEEGTPYLCAYIVTGSGGDIDASRLRSDLAKHLPDYMIPSYFVPLEQIPLTPNGKIDRKALYKYETKGEVRLPYVAPRNQTEKAIAGIWRQVLHREQVGIHHNFFDLGGNSMDIIRVNQRLKEELGIEIPVVYQFRYTTISSLGQYLSERKTTDFNLQAKQQQAIDNGKALLKNLKKKMTTM